MTDTIDLDPAEFAGQSEVLDACGHRQGDRDHRGYLYQEPLMKRDLRINYGILDTVLTRIDDYTRALEDMRRAIEAIDSLIEASSGQSIDALGECKQRTLDAVQTFYGRLADLRSVLFDYIGAMTSEIQPLDRFSMTRADSNDTWWNVWQISQANKSIRKYDWIYTPSDADQAALQHNLAAIDDIHNTAAALKSTLDGHIDRLWALHEKVVCYENIDDTHRTKIDELYWRYTDRTGVVLDFLGVAGGGVADVFIGFAAGLVTIVQGLYGVLEYMFMGLTFWITKPVGTPDSVTEYMTEANDTIGTVLADPMLIFEGIAQDMGDTADEKGMPYFTGSLIPDVIGTIFGAKGIDKIAKVGKVRVLDDVADAADAAGDVGRAGGAGKLLDQNLMAELAASGAKYTPEDVVMVVRDADGRLLWLEEGNSGAGLEHILDGHLNDF